MKIKPLKIKLKGPKWPQMTRQSNGTRKLCVYVDTTFTRRYGEAATDEALVCVAEPGNSHDRNAVVVERDRKVVGHLPQKVSWLYTFF